MRIILLPKFVLDEVAEPHSLKNCRLVIDGQIFLLSYQDSKLNYILGCEANNYATYLRKLLQMFKNANVECYIVFKGGSTDFEKKIENLNARYERPSHQAVWLPIFAKETCIQVLDELGYKYATSLFEHKKDCVALAKSLNCAVLGNDIDYCFKGAPYINSTTLKYDPQIDQTTCKQYKIKYFMDKFSLTETKVAIFAALLDITVFELNHFNDLFLKWNVFDQNMYLQIKKLLVWLSEHTEEEALNSVSGFLSNEFEKQKFLNQVKKVLEFMTHDDSDVVANYLMNFDQNGKDLPISYCDPKWFEKGIATQNIAVRYIDLYTHKSILGSWVEGGQSNANDSLLFSIDIIKYAYNLLTNFKSTQINVYHKVKDFIKINTEYNARKPIYQCAESVFESGWQNLKQLKLFEHFLVTNDIDTDQIKEFPVEARMLFITLIYFARKKTTENVQVTKEVYCFIVSYVLLHVVFDKKDTPRKKKHQINEADSLVAKFDTKKYFILCKQNVIDDNVLETLFELQYCLLHMNYLNSLCGAPFMTTKYHRTFNGTFVYQLLMDIQGGDEKEFIATLFKTAPSVLGFINKLISTYEKLV